VLHKCKMVHDHHFEKNDILLYFSNRLYDFDGILHGDAYWPSGPEWLFEKFKFKTVQDGGWKPF